MKYTEIAVDSSDFKRHSTFEIYISMGINQEPNPIGD